MSIFVYLYISSVFTVFMFQKVMVDCWAVSQSIIDNSWNKFLLNLGSGVAEDDSGQFFCFQDF